MELLTKELYERWSDFKIDSHRINLVQSFQITLKELNNINKFILKFMYEPALINSSTKSEIVAYRAKAQILVELMKNAIDFFNQYDDKIEHKTMKSVYNDSLMELKKIDQSSKILLPYFKEN